MTKSISATYKKLRGNEKILFPVTLWGIAFPVMFVGMYDFPFLSRILFFISGTFLLLVSVSPMFWKNETPNNRQQAFTHYMGSYGGIGVGMIACLVYYFSSLTIIIVSLYATFTFLQMFVRKLQLRNYIYWVEVVALFSVCVILWMG